MTNPARRMALALGVALAFGVALHAPQASASADQPTASSGSYPDALKAAQTLEQKAVDRVCAWTVTEDALKKARALHAKDKDAQALAAAQKAQDYAQLSLAQCDQQDNLWKLAVVK